MPEGPEVRIISEQLAKHVNNQTLQEIDIVGGRFVQSPPENFGHFGISLPSKITEVKCKGKFIWFALENDWYIFNTLGMTGSWSTKKEKHAAIRLRLVDKEVYFFDPRHFGTVKLAYGKETLQQKLNSIGIDLLEVAISNKDITKSFTKLIQSRSETLAEILMNQKILTGVGNYIKAESLYAAKLSPWRRGNSLSTTECSTLLENTTRILLDSYRLGGATLATYKNFEGQTGWYSSKLKVYKKLTDPNGLKVKNDETNDKRVTWWVPQIQK